MASLKSTSLSDSYSLMTTAKILVNRFGFGLLIFFFSLSSFSQVVINEIVTDPQQDWDTNGFNGTPGAGMVTFTDEWIELYITADAVDLTGWTIEITDGGFFSGDLTSRDVTGTGAFQQTTYFGSGSFTNTQAGDYLVLGNPLSSENITNDVHIVLRDNTATIIDEVELGSDFQLDGTADDGPDGNAFGVDDESVGRISNGVDTNNDADDLRHVISTMGSENGRSIVYVDAAAADDSGFGSPSVPLQSIQSGVNLALIGGTVLVNEGSYAESVTINKRLTLEGGNAGIAADGTRLSESAIDVAGTAFTITSDNVIFDGFQIGTNASTSSVNNGIVSSGNDNITIRNSIIYANSIGISIDNTSDGTSTINDNLVSMLALEDATNLTNGSIGMAITSVLVDALVFVDDNDITNAFAGISTYDNIGTIIDGGTYTGCTTGVLPVNFDGVGGFAPSAISVLNLTMSGFATNNDIVAGTDVGGTEAGVYVVTVGGGALTDDITIDIQNLDVSGVGNEASNHSGIIIGDFGSDGIGIDATITNCNIHDNENRGIYTRGADAVTNISQCSITGNGFNPHAASGNPGFSVIARESSSTTVSNCFITNPATLSSPEDIPNNYYVSGLHISTGGSLTINDCSFNGNGNGFIAESSGIDLSGNYFSTTVEATINTAVNSNDFTPWLSSGTDTDLVANGFQGDFSSLIVGLSGTQTGASGRIEEAIGLVDASGTVLVNAGTYAENLTISKSLTLNGANQGVAGSGTRSAETIIEPSSASVGITLGTNDITIDGFQFGTDNANSNLTTAISNTGFSGVAVNNNRIFANAVGVLVSGVSSGTVSLSSNYVEMLGLANPLLSTSASVGLAMVNITGSADVDFDDNNILTATYGIGTFGLTSSAVPEIDGGTFSGCTIGISTSNFDGTASFSASSLNILNVTMSGFTGPDGGITGSSGIPQAGIYAFTTASAPSTDHDLTVNVDTADISGVGNGATDYAGILAADFFNTDPDLEVTDDKGITMTVSNSDISNNTNRGIHSRGADAVVTVNTSTISNNTNAGGVVFAHGTLNINNSFIVLPSTGVTSGLLAQTDGTITASNSHFDLNGNAEVGTLIANIQDPAGDETIELSASWLSTTDETTILTLVDESDTDYSPWLTSDTDTDLVNLGFQPDLSGVQVGTGGSQTTGFLSEAHGIVSTDGSITINSDTYAETLTVTKNISIIPEAGTSIDDVALAGGNLNVVNNTFTINNALTMTSGIFDIDQEDGNKDDDPVFVLPGTVNGTSYAADTHFEGRIQSSVTGASSFTFEVGDEGAYRPVVLTPTTTTTFQVAHISAATPSGGGATNPDITNLIGDASGNPVGTIESVLNFRYWDIDVAAGGPPGLTNVALQITASDQASDPSSLGMTRFDGSDWSVMTLASATGSDPYVITGQTSSFSEFSIYSTDVMANPLPVELVDFYGVRKGDKINLSWSTLTEINSDHFQLERSEDGLDFNSIGIISSHGNSNERIDYQFMDTDVSSVVYYYRLKMVDFDGTYEYSPIILISPDLSDVRIVMFPNPTTDKIFLEGIESTYFKQLDFYDLQGKMHKTFNTFDSNSIVVSDLSPGQYILRLLMTDGSVFEGSIVKK